MTILVTGRDQPVQSDETVTSNATADQVLRVKPVKVVRKK